MIAPDVRKVVLSVGDRCDSETLAAGRILADALISKHPELAPETLAAVVIDIATFASTSSDRKLQAFLAAVSYDLLTRTT